MIASTSIKAGFGKTARYLEHGEGASYTENPEERVAWSETRNLISEDREGVVREMFGVAASSKRVERPCYHLVISWNAGDEKRGIPADNPTRAQMTEAADAALRKLGLEKHQAWIVAHKDGGADHLHLMVNRVSPRSGKVWKVEWDYPKLWEVMRTQEARHGFRVNGAAKMQDLWREKNQGTFTSQRARNEERPHALRAWEEYTDMSFREAADKAVGDSIAEASGWAEVEAALAKHELRLEPRYEKGMVMAIGEDYLAMSTVRPAFSRPNLEARFGQTWNEYQKEQAQRVERKEAWQKEKREATPGDSKEKEQRVEEQEAEDQSKGKALGEAPPETKPPEPRPLLAEDRPATPPRTGEKRDGSEQTTPRAQAEDEASEDENLSKEKASRQTASKKNRQLTNHKKERTPMETGKRKGDKVQGPVEQGRWARQGATRTGQTPEQEALTFAARYYREALEKAGPDHPARRYLSSERAVSEKTRRDFDVGFAPDKWNGLTRAAAKEGISGEVLESAGLAYERRDGQGHFDRFRGRMMMPWTDENGQVPGFGACRVEGLNRRTPTLNDNPKYVNSPDSDIFHKREELYGLGQAQEAIRREKHVYVTEGYMDAMQMRQAGLPNTVALAGARMTDEHAERLAALTGQGGEMTFVMDGDEAGRVASRIGTERAVGAGTYPHVAELPEGQDADSFIRERGASAFREALEGRRTLAEETMRGLEEATPYDRSAMVREAIERAADAPTPEMRERLFQGAAEVATRGSSEAGRYYQHKTMSEHFDRVLEREGAERLPQEERPAAPELPKPKFSETSVSQSSAAGKSAAGESDMQGSRPSYEELFGKPALSKEDIARGEVKAIELSAYQEAGRVRQQAEAAHGHALGVFREKLEEVYRNPERAVAAWKANAKEHGEEVGRDSVVKPRSYGDGFDSPGAVATRDTMTLYELERASIEITRTRGALEVASSREEEARVAYAGKDQTAEQARIETSAPKRAPITQKETRSETNGEVQEESQRRVRQNVAGRGSSTDGSRESDLFDEGRRVAAGERGRALGGNGTGHARFNEAGNGRAAGSDRDAQARGARDRAGAPGQKGEQTDRGGHTAGLEADRGGSEQGRPVGRGQTGDASRASRGGGRAAGARVGQEGAERSAAGPRTEEDAEIDAIGRGRESDKRGLGAARESDVGLQGRPAGRSRRESGAGHENGEGAGERRASRAKGFDGGRGEGAEGQTEARKGGISLSDEEAYRYGIGSNRRSGNSAGRAVGIGDSVERGVTAQSGSATTAESSVLQRKVDEWKQSVEEFRQKPQSEQAKIAAKWGSVEGAKYAGDQATGGAVSFVEYAPKVARGAKQAAQRNTGEASTQAAKGDLVTGPLQEGEYVQHVAEHATPFEEGPGRIKRFEDVVGTRMAEVEAFPGGESRLLPVDQLERRRAQAQAEGQRRSGEGAGSSLPEGASLEAQGQAKGYWQAQIEKVRADQVREAKTTLAGLGASGRWSKDILEDARKAEARFDEKLGEIYVRPQEAKRRFDGLAEEGGFREAVQTVYDDPEVLGRMHGRRYMLAWNNHEREQAMTAAETVHRYGANHIAHHAAARHILEGQAKLAQFEEAQMGYFEQKEKTIGALEKVYADPGAVLDRLQEATPTRQPDGTLALDGKVADGRKGDLIATMEGSPETLGQLRGGSAGWVDDSEREASRAAVPEAIQEVRAEAEMRGEMNEAQTAAESASAMLDGYQKEVKRIEREASALPSEERSELKAGMHRSQLSPEGEDLVVRQAEVVATQDERLANAKTVYDGARVETVRASQEVDRAFGRLYDNPEQARASFEQAAGFDTSKPRYIDASVRLQNSPETFGAIKDGLSAGESRLLGKDTASVHKTYAGAAVKAGQARRNLNEAQNTLNQTIVQVPGATESRGHGGGVKAARSTAGSQAAGMAARVATRELRKAAGVDQSV